MPRNAPGRVGGKPLGSSFPSQAVTARADRSDCHIERPTLIVSLTRESLRLPGSFSIRRSDAASTHVHSTTEAGGTLQFANNQAARSSSGWIFPQPCGPWTRWRRLGGTRSRRTIKTSKQEDGIRSITRQTETMNPRERTQTPGLAGRRVTPRTALKRWQKPCTFNANEAKFRIDAKALSCNILGRRHRVDRCDEQTQFPVHGDGRSGRLVHRSGGPKSDANEPKSAGTPRGISVVV